jgi:hypothetical protein
MIAQLAERILAEDPDPIVRFRLLRDVLRTPADSPDLALAQKALERSRWVQELAAEQRADGGWGRFHTTDTRSKQRISTTEAGVERALALGLDATHPLLRKTSDYLGAILAGSIRFPDGAERNERWATGWRLFTAATLARIEPNASILDDTWSLWAEIAQRTLTSGAHDREAELGAHRDLAGVSKEIGYLTLSNKYAVSLLASRAQRLPAFTERALVTWLWRKPRGLGYMDVALHAAPAAAGPLDRWFASLGLMAGFPTARVLARDVLDWIWSRRNERGLWDFGPARSAQLSLSENARRKHRREHDWSTRTLALLRRYGDT